MTVEFTRVEITFYPEFVNDWLRFGAPEKLHHLDRRRSVALLIPGRVFGYVRWRAGEFGTSDWQFTVGQTVDRNTRADAVRGIDPGAIILLSARGKTMVKRALARIDALEADGFALTDVSTEYFRHVHNRIASGKPPWPYSADQHEAHLARRQVLG